MKRRQTDGHTNHSTPEAQHAYYMSYCMWVNEEAGFRVYSRIKDTGVASLWRSNLWTINCSEGESYYGYFLHKHLHTGQKENLCISPRGEAQGLVLDMAVPTTQHTFTHSGLFLLPRGDPKWWFE